MPQVPKLPYSPVQRAGLPVVQNDMNFSPDQFGAGIGRTVENESDRWGQIALQARHEADQVAVQDRLNQFDTKNNARLAKADQTKGEAAFGLPQSVNEEFDKDASDIGNTLNDRQREIYNRQIDGRRVATNRFLDAHVAGQAAAYRDETYENGKRNALDTVGVNYADEGVVNAAINDQVSKTEAYATATGKSPEWRKNEHTNIVSSAHATVIGRYLTDQDTAGAQAHFERYGDEMSAQDRDAVKKALSGANDMKKSQAAVDALMTEKGDFNGGIGLQAGLDKIRDQYKDDPTTRAMAEQRWVTAYKQRENAYNDETNGMFNRIYSVIVDPNNNAGMDSASMVDRTALLARDPRLYDTLEKANAMKLRREAPVTNWAVYYGLQSQAANPAGRDSFLKTNLLQYRNDLSDTEFKELAKLQAEMNQSGTSGQAAQGLLTRQEVVDRALVNLGIDPKPYTAKDGSVTINEPAMRFTDMVNKAIVAQETATNKKVTPEEVQKIADKMVIEQAYKVSPSGLGKFVNFTGFGIPGAVFGIGRDSEKKAPLFQLPGADRLAFSISQIPASELEKIRDSASRAGRTLTDDQIVTLYNANVRNQANAGQ